MLPIEQLHAGTTTSEPHPIWMAALQASGCLAKGGGIERQVDWQWFSGRAHYTNASPDTEIIQPFGVRVGRGETVTVYWLPGETAYTVELLYERDSLAA